MTERSNITSPDRLPQVSDPELEAIRVDFQLAAYACMDLEIPRPALYRRVLQAQARAMGGLARQFRQLRAVQQQVVVLRQKLEETTQQLHKATQQLEEDLELAVAFPLVAEQQASGEPGQQEQQASGEPGQQEEEEEEEEEEQEETPTN
ncbi:protein FAM9A-like [Dicentrarchus labrax]|uniref:protein FAM9A-like n=1 Tax=Dicentrarchus labrax TaxID=13489 RepID=UPI0021F681FB|nr:protein FAM9A-like [Dicentrarchus labrax]